MDVRGHLQSPYCVLSQFKKKSNYFRLPVNIVLTSQRCHIIFFKTHIGFPTEKSDWIDTITGDAHLSKIYYSWNDKV
jgi:hypothetical protein